MCGIVGVISSHPVVQDDLLAMRDQLVHRGPDDQGILTTPSGTLAHTRLSIIDPTSHGHQPMTTPDGRFTIVYNGELYNDQELRTQLQSLGVHFQSQCDTETVLHAVAQWGMEARHKLRGMYAFGVIDTHNRVCLLARDPLGVKPLYLSKTSDEIIFASEIGAILKHPKINPKPDRVAMSAYLSSIRPEFGNRTMFEGIETVEPGTWSLYSIDACSLIETKTCWDRQSTTNHQDTTEVIEDSVIRHLRTDVPMCALLSGGLDSSIIAKIAMDQLGELKTFCAGARSDGFDDDFAMARLVSKHLGTDHTEVEVAPDTFLTRWLSMVNTTGIPLSTPNEVAIYEVCSVLRKHGFPVTLSGEGADELFGGYEHPLIQAQAFVDHIPDSDRVAGRFHLQSNAWINDEHKPMVMQDSWKAVSAGDSELRSWYQRSFDSLRESTEDSMQAHLAFYRKLNLPNLLRRLDQASMLSSVEGRTPFADLEVAMHAESLPMNRRFIAGQSARTKIVLREAFNMDLPAPVIQRAKASFPLPFQDWIGSMANILHTSQFAQEYFTSDAINAVTSDPARQWNLAWPMLNLTIWGERWWGAPISIEEAQLAAQPS
jgi:asparagine synthase (glutamine-hydrolysing)